MFAMAIVRFVNNITSEHQTQLYAISIAQIAHRIGLPRLLVDLRHEASHRTLPFLPLLRYGAKLALNWLRRHYWQEQEGHLSELRERVLAKLAKLRNLQVQLTAEEKKSKTMRVKLNTKRCVWCQEMSVHYLSCHT